MDLYVVQVRQNEASILDRMHRHLCDHEAVAAASSHFVWVAQDRVRVGLFLLNSNLDFISGLWDLLGIRCR